MEILKKYFPMILAASFLFIISFLLYRLFSLISSVFLSLDKDIAVAVVTASATLLAATATVMFGRYFERKREIEAHFRGDKIKIYDEFLKEFHEIFSTPNKDDTEAFVEFVKEWNRKIILWGDPQVLLSYLEWNQHIKSGKIDIDSLLLMEYFYKKMREDIGQSNRGLEKGTFVRLMLRDSGPFIENMESNPEMDLVDLDEDET